MGNEKKKMGKKPFSRPLSCSKDNSRATVLEVLMNEREQTAGFGERHPFLRTNDHSGPIPWTDSLRRARPRRGNPQHFVSQHRGMVRRMWQGILADTKAHRPTAKTAKNMPQHPINYMLKCLSAHLHVTSYLTRFLAKTCNKFKSTAIGACAATNSTTSKDPDTKFSVHLLHPCIPTDGQFLAPR